MWHDGDVTLRRAKQVQGSLTKLADLLCTVFGIGSRHELSAFLVEVMEQYGPMAPAIAAPFLPQLKPILGPELTPDSGAAYDRDAAVKVFRAIDDDEAGIELWRGLPEASGIAIMTIFKGIRELLIIMKRDAAAFASAIPHRRGGGRPPEKRPDDATCREIRRKIQSLHNSGLGIPKMEAYERVAHEYGKSTRMIRRIYAIQK
jgi:hypothetical protein